MVQGMTPEDFAGVFNHSIKREGDGVRIEVAVKVSALGEQITQFNRAKIARIIEEERKIFKPGKHGGKRLEKVC